MPYAPVKTSKYGPRPRPRQSHLWSDRTWRHLVLVALLAIRPAYRRTEIARFCSFRFTEGELAPTAAEAPA